jgi:hypothetical protein
MFLKGKIMNQFYKGKNLLGEEMADALNYISGENGFRTLNEVLLLLLNNYC